MAGKWCVTVPGLVEESGVCRNCNVSVNVTEQSQLPPALPDFTKFNFTKCISNWTCGPVIPPNETTAQTTATLLTTTAANGTDDCKDPCCEATDLECCWLWFLSLLLILLIAAIAYQYWQYRKLKAKWSAVSDDDSTGSSEKCSDKNKSDEEGSKPRSASTEKTPNIHINPTYESFPAEKLATEEVPS